MKKSIIMLLTLCLLLFGAGSALAAETLQYTVAEEPVILDADGNGSFRITVLENSEENHGVSFQVMFPAGHVVENSGITYNKSGDVWELETVSTGAQIFGIRALSGTYSGDVTCTIAFRYTGDLSEEIPDIVIENIKQSVGVQPDDEGEGLKPDLAIELSHPLRVRASGYDPGTEDYYTIAVNKPNGGTITTTPSGSAKAGETVDLSISVASRYRFNSWTVTDASGNSVSVSSSTSRSASFTMPAANVTVSASLTYTGSDGTTGSGGGDNTTNDNTTITTPDTPLGHSGFTDVPSSHWAYEFIMYLAERGFVTGKTSTIFGPSDPITRAEFITILARMSGDSVPASYSGAFTDVVADAYYAGPVAWGVAAQVVQGTSTTTYSPARQILRQEIAAMIVRYAGFKSFGFTETNAALSFTDAAQVHDYAREAISTMQKADIINGYEDSSFGPLRNATRAEVAKMLALVHQQMNQ